MKYGVRVAEQELVDLFEPEEGSVNFYYGRIGGGKTYNATADILELLERGEVVYCNWPIRWEGFDERESRSHIFWKTLFGRKRFFAFKKENLRYFNPDDVDVEFLSHLTDCHVFIDEGQWIFDSYQGRNFPVEKRRLILHTRHMNRTLNIISQRTQAVAVTARGQVNRFYKCDVKLRIFGRTVFRRTEYQDMSGDDVDETADPISVKVYWSNPKVFDAYDTHYLREQMPASQRVKFEAYDIPLAQRIEMFVMHVLLKRPFYAPVQESQKVEDTREAIFDARLDVLGALAAVRNKKRNQMVVSPYVLDLSSGQVILPQISRIPRRRTFKEWVSGGGRRAL